MSETKEQMYQVNYAALSNDTLLRVWLEHPLEEPHALDEIGIKMIEELLIKRDVLKKV